MVTLTECFIQIIRLQRRIFEAHCGLIGDRGDSIPSHGLWYEVYVKSAKIKGLYSQSDFPSDDWTKLMSRLEMIHVAVR